MIINKLILVGYKPLLPVSNIHKLQLGFDKDIVSCLLGKNGGGKSSTLFELSPYPAVSSNYKKNGKKEIHLTHNKSNYVLISDFNSKIKTHYFYKDDKDLNISGKFNIQQELCESELGYSQFIDKLTSNKFNMSTMRRAERREFFLRLYPSDMSFISTYYKKLCAEIKGQKSNIKMLEERKAALNDKVMDNHQLNDLRELRNNIEDFNSELDKLIYVINHENTELNNMLLDSNSLTIEDIEKECTLIKDTIEGIKHSDIRLFTKEFVPNKKEIVNKKIENTKQLSVIKDDITQLKDKIEKLEEFKNTDTDKLIHELKEHIHMCTTELNSIIYNMQYAIIPEEAIEHVELEILPKLKTQLMILHSTNCKIYDNATINKIKNKIDEYHLDLTDLRTNYEIYSKKLKELHNRALNHKKYDYPTECNLKCGIKNYVKKIIDNTQNEITFTTDKLDKIKASVKKYKKRSERLKMLIQYIPTIQPILDDIENLIAWNDWAKMLLDGQSVVTILNNDLFKLSNNLIKFLTHSKAHIRVKKIKQEIENKTCKLQVIEEAQIPTQQLINETLIEKQMLYNQQLDKHIVLQKNNIQYDNDINKLDTIISRVNKYDYIKNEFKVLRHNLLIENRIKYNNGVLKQLTLCKNIVSSKLLEVKTTIEEQEKILTILNDEIKPTLKTLYIKLKKFMNVEKALSPKTGMPQKYITSLINSIITIANNCIEKIATYPMELVYLEENKTLDFSIKVRFDTAVLNDITMCSSAQKHIIGIAITIASYIYGEYYLQYPLKLDELDAYLSQIHESRIIEFLAKTVKEYNFPQLLLVVQHSVLFTAFQNCEIYCLSDDDNIILPIGYNKNLIKS